MPDSRPASLFSPLPSTLPGPVSGGGVPVDPQTLWLRARSSYSDTQWLLTDAQQHGTHVHTHSHTVTQTHRHRVNGCHAARESALGNAAAALHTQ